MARMTLDDLTGQLQQMHGGKLRCVLLYGSAASGDHVASSSDLNVLVLVDSIEPAQLEALAQTVRAWEEAGNPAPLELTVAEWERSADIFPMEYADILERHRVVFGTLPLEHVHVEPGDLRRQTEFEAMSKVLRLRQGIMRAGSDPKLQIALIRDSHSALMVVFRAVLRTAGERSPKDRSLLIERVAALSGLDPEPFLRAHALVRAEAKVPAQDAPRLLLGLLSGMETLTRWLDSHVSGQSSILLPDA